MEMPKTVYHGTFWPESKGTSPRNLKTNYGYVSTTPDQIWARYFAMCKRVEHKKLPGNVLIYQIGTDKLPQKVRENCIPPDGIDKRVLEYDSDWLRKNEEDIRKDRIRFQEWRFLYIPAEAILDIEELHKDAQPKLNIFTVAFPR